MEIIEDLHFEEIKQNQKHFARFRKQCNEQFFEGEIYPSPFYRGQAKTYYYKKWQYYIQELNPKSKLL